MKLYHLSVVVVFLLWGITLSSFADEQEKKNILWTSRLPVPRSNIISTSSARPPEEGYQSYEYNVKDEAFCRIPEGSKVLLSILVDEDYEEYFIPKDQWDSTELSRHCNTSGQVLLIMINSQKRVFWVTTSIPNTSSALCAKTVPDEIPTGGGSSIYYPPTSYLYLWYYLPELVVDKNYFILDYDRKIEISATPYEREQLKQEKLSFIQSLNQIFASKNNF